MRRIALLTFALLALGAYVRGEDLSQFKTADDLWAYIQTKATDPKSPDVAGYTQQMEDLRGGLLAVEGRFPDDARRWDAKLMRIRIESTLAQLNDRPTDNAAVLQATKEIISASDASAATKADARYLAASVHLETLESSGDPKARAVVDADIAGLRKDYPDDQRTASLQYELAGLLKLRDPDAAESMFRELEKSKNVQIAAMAQQQMESIKLARKLAKESLDLKFRAVDGTDVDLAKLRGKVVLVDFWATWCGPCRVELPNVVAAYNQFHKDGFEIVGISLDQDKDKLVSFTKGAGMTWPQYFDGKSWGNDISTRYGINEIPTAWLVDKKGFVRSTEVRGPSLAEQVKKLLAE